VYLLAKLNDTEATMSGAADEEAEGGSLLLNQPVVIDNGTSSIKAGFAGSSKPKVRTFHLHSGAKLTVSTL
jgi:hypothetical protein